VPPVKGDGIMQLNDIIGPDGVGEITNLGELRFQALGDTGVNHADMAEQIAEEMAGDFRAGAGALNPAFLFHLGDIIYGPGKEDHYGERFYRPYRRYPGKIIAIPGNHDGESRSAADEPSLNAFQANFCAETAAVPNQASNSGIYRETMTQPGVYWMLDAPFLRIVGLYSSRLENPGFLEGDGGNDTSQLVWLKKTLTGISRSRESKALIIATHHPPYSSGGHDGSTEMTVRQAEDVKLVVFACEAGMGSSLIGANQLKKRVKDAGLTVRVIHSPVNQIPGDADVVLAHEGLVARARAAAPGAVVLPFKQFLNNPASDLLVRRLQAGEPISDEAAGA